MRFKRIVNLFKKGNVCVTGLRGTGKDILFGNVIARRNIPYVSNLDYGGLYNPLCLNDICIPNTYVNLINDNINEYIYPYPLGSDIYISDAGIYLPSQYCNQLNRDYQGLITYQALSRQVSHNNVHINVQNLNRLWDKVREQSEIYIRCNWCKVLFKKIVIQKITIYDKYQSCLDRVSPCRIRKPNMFMDKEKRLQYELYRDKFYNTYGDIRSYFLIYINKSNHDTYYFEKLFRKDK